MLTDTSASPYAKLRSVGLADVRWTRGFWHDQFERCHAVMIPNMWRIWQDPDISHQYANFRIAAGEEEGSHKGPPFADGDFYKWLEATAAVYAVTRDEELDCLMDELIALLGRVQREDGYIHTPVLIRQRQGTEAAAAFQERLHFESYNLGHLITAGCIHYRATGKTSLLDIGKRAADYLYRFYQTAPVEMARNAICPSHYMGVIELYRTTRDPKYLELGQSLIEIRDLVVGGSDDNQDRLPFHAQDRALGHAVRANYLYAGVADVVAETGDMAKLDVLERLWDNVVRTKMYITGGCGALYDGASPDGTPHQEVITRVHQAYGREYQLPNVTAYNETCANIGNVLWNWRMLNLTGEARFADIVELVLYNSALSAISLDGRHFFYSNTLRQVDDLPFELRWPKTRAPYISSFCCPPNIVRTIAEVGAYAYSLADDGLRVNLYGSNILDTRLPDGGRLRLVQATDYPWDGRVRLRVEETGGEPLTLLLRIPGWAVEATVSVNGGRVPATPEPGTYFRVAPALQAGDEVELDLPMPVRVFEAHPLVEETRNQVAVMRGPLVYCLESIDLPAGVRPTDVVIPRTVQFAARVDDHLGGALDGIVVVEGEAKLLPDPREPSLPLYRDVRTAPLRDIHIKLIPYYAWDNRGKSEMTVWLPLAW